jgi:hypothetical protein
MENSTEAPKKWEIKLSHCLGITLPGIQPKEIKWANDRDNGIPMFIAAHSENLRYGTSLGPNQKVNKMVITRIGISDRKLGDIGQRI